MKQLLIQLNDNIVDNLSLLMYAINNKEKYDKLIVFSDEMNKLSIFLKYIAIKTDIFTILPDVEGNVLCNALKENTKNGLITNIAYDFNETDFIREVIDMRQTDSYISAIKKNFVLNIDVSIVRDFDADNINFKLQEKDNIVLELRNKKFISSPMYDVYFPIFYKAINNSKKNISLYIDNEGLYDEIFKKFFGNNVFIFDNLKSKDTEKAVNKYIYEEWKDKDYDYIYEKLIEDKLKYAYYCAQLNNIFIYPGDIQYLMHFFIKSSD